LSSTAPRPYGPTAMSLFRPHILKTPDQLTIALYGFLKHAQRPHPEIPFAIQRAVDHKGLFCFRMPGHADHLIKASFEVPVFTWLQHVSISSATCRSLLARSTVSRL